MIPCSLTNFVLQLQVSYAVYQAAKEAPAGSPRGKKRSATNEVVATNGHGGAAGAKFVEHSSPIPAAKAVKNETELAGFREAHLRDAVAICDFLCWFEAQVGAATIFRGTFAREPRYGSDFCSPTLG